MTARRVEVLVTDVDGTLTDQYGTVGVEALAALHKLVARGVTVVLASALPFFILKALSIYLGARGPIIAESGGVVEVNGKIIVLGDAELARRGLRALKERYGNLVKEKWSNRCRLTDIAREEPTLRGGQEDTGGPRPNPVRHQVRLPHSRLKGQQGEGASSPLQGARSPPEQGSRCRR